jgi:hypothetical protein
MQPPVPRSSFSRVVQRFLLAEQRFEARGLPKAIQKRLPLGSLDRLNGFVIAGEFNPYLVQPQAFSFGCLHAWRRFGIFSAVEASEMWQMGHS